MKAIITSVLIVFVVGFVIQQVSASGIVSFGQGSFTGIDMNRMEAKMSEALKSLSARPQIRAALNTDSNQDNSMYAPINNSSSISSTNTNSLINPNKVNLGIEDELSSLRSSTASIADELQTIKNETSSLETKANAIGSSSELNLGSNKRSPFNISVLDSTTNLTKDDMNGINSSVNLALNSSNSTDVNLTAANLSASFFNAKNLAVNSTGSKLSEENLSVSKTVGSAESAQNIATQQIGGSMSGAINGFWGFQSSQHQMGGHDINSRTFLRGDFNVDKSVKFSDRGA